MKEISDAMIAQPAGFFFTIVVLSIAIVSIINILMKGLWQIIYAMRGYEYIKTKIKTDDPSDGEQERLRVEYGCSNKKKTKDSEQAKSA